MKSILTFLLIAGLATPLAAQQQTRHRSAKRPARKPAQTEAAVYVCNGPYAKKWHRLESCAAGNCRSSVSRMKLSAAKARYSGGCGRCW